MGFISVYRRGELGRVGFVRCRQVILWGDRVRVFRALELVLCRVLRRGNGARKALLAEGRIRLCR